MATTQKTSVKGGRAVEAVGVLNCWERMGCGREVGGAKAAELGACPAARGHGRDCWLVAGTLCGGEVQGVFAEKLGNCQACDFYRQVMSGQI
ncbi:MAG: hypothetical protein HY908_31800 [Myxococcales bacterium]|nr:hypothetical protein [Myxococcales bacterium]